MTAKASEVDGKISWSGIPSDAQLKAILDIPNDIIPPGMKDTITDIVEKMKTPGQSIIIDYNPAMGSGKRYSSNLSSGLRIAVPIGFNISKSKNFLYYNTRSWRNEYKAMTGVILIAKHIRILIYGMATQNYFDKICLSILRIIRMTDLEKVG